MKKILVNEEQAYVRVDKFLAEQTEYSRAIIQKMLEEGKISVNSVQVKPKYNLQVNDEIIIHEEYKPEEFDMIAQDLNLDVIYEDDDVIVINKPSAMVVHPAAGNPDKTLVNGLLYHVEQLSDSGESFRPGIVHRIDKDTSGLLMVAKNDFAHAFLAQQLKDKTAKRKYVAIVHGQIVEDEAQINAPIGRDPANRKKMAVTSDNSKPATTNLKVLERFNNYTLIECQLETGRTHQIRVHLKFIKHPVVGDPLYGPRKTIDTIGQALHAQVLGFIHPTTKEEMLFEADPPEEFMKTLNFIRETDG